MLLVNTLIFAATFRTISVRLSGATGGTIHWPEGTILLPTENSNGTCVTILSLLFSWAAANSGSMVSVNIRMRDTFFINHLREFVLNTLRYCIRTGKRSMEA